MAFNPMLSQNVSGPNPVRTTVQSPLEGIAQLASTAVGLYDTAQKAQKAKEIDTEVNRLLTLEMDAVDISGLSQTQALRQVESEIRNIKDPTRQTEIRQALAQARGSRVGSDLRGSIAQEQASVEQERKGNLSLIPAEYRAAFGKFQPDGTMTDADEADLIFQYKEYSLAKLQADLDAQKAQKLAGTNSRVGLTTSFGALSTSVNNSFVQAQVAMDRELQAIGTLPESEQYTRLQGLKSTASQLFLNSKLATQNWYNASITDPNLSKEDRELAKQYLDSTNAMISAMEERLKNDDLNVLKKTNDQLTILQNNFSKKGLDAFGSIYGMRQAIGDNMAGLAFDRAVLSGLASSPNFVNLSNAFDKGLAAMQEKPEFLGNKVATYIQGGGTTPEATSDVKRGAWGLVSASIQSGNYKGDTPEIIDAQLLTLGNMMYEVQTAGDGSSTDAIVTLMKNPNFNDILSKGSPMAQDAIGRQALGIIERKFLTGPDSIQRTVQRLMTASDSDLIGAEVYWDKDQAQILIRPRKSNNPHSFTGFVVTSQYKAAQREVQGINNIINLLKQFKKYDETYSIMPDKDLVSSFLAGSTPVDEPLAVTPKAPPSGAISDAVKSYQDIVNPFKQKLRSLAEQAKQGTNQ